MYTGKVKGGMRTKIATSETFEAAKLRNAAACCMPICIYKHACCVCLLVHVASYGLPRLT